MKAALSGLFAVLLVSPAGAQRSHAVTAQPLPTYVTQLGKTHFPGGEAALLDSGQAVAALPSGAVLVAGATYGSLGEPNGAVIPQIWPTPDAFLARFDPSGNVEWIRQLGAITAPTIPALNGNAGGPGGDASGYDIATDVAVAPDGSIFVTGYTRSNLGETNSQGDMFLAKFDRDGALLWLRQVGAESAGSILPHTWKPLDPSGGDRGSALLIDPSGAVYVAGDTSGDLAEEVGGSYGMNGDVFLARFTADGELEWLRQMGDWSSWYVGFKSWNYDYSRELALHPSGAILLASSSDDWQGNLTGVHLFAFDARGKLLDAQGLPGELDERAGGLAVDRSSGLIFLAGSTWEDLAEPSGGGGDVFVACFDGNLDLQWMRQLGSTAAASLGLLDVTGVEHVVGIRLDDAGDLILAGSTTGALDEPNAGAWRDVFTAKVRASDGEFLWVSQIGKTQGAILGLGAKSDDEVFGMGLDPWGSIVITGDTDGSLAETQAGSGDVFVMRLNPDGSL